jgi:hypothetical protein
LKKLIAIALLCLQIFTICGHILFYQYFVYQSDKLFNDQISKNRYNVNDLVEIKVPLRTPAAQNWHQFESISGQVQFKNTCYNYVKLKLTRDTIYLVCIPNYEKTRLYNQNIINAKDIADIPVNKKDHVPFGKIVSLDNYNHVLTSYKFTPAIALLAVRNSGFYPDNAEHYIAVPEQPPKISC